MARPRSLDIAGLSAAVYDAALDAALWPDVLEQLRTVFGATCVSMNGYDLRRKQCFMLSAGRDPAATESYIAYYGKMNPLIAPMVHQPVGSVTTDDMVVPKRSLTCSEFYADWLRPQGIWQGLSGTAMRDNTMASGITITRGQHQDEFDAEDAAALHALLPHLGRAIKTTSRLAMAEVRGVGLETLLDQLADGALLLSAEGTVLYANPAAEALLRLRDGLSTVQGRLHAARQADDVALRRALAAAGATGGGAVRVERPSGQPPFAITMHSAAARCLATHNPWYLAHTPAALMFVIDPARAANSASKALNTLFGLTPAEAAVANAIAKGHGAKDAAEMLSIAPSTVRWHLQRVFEKTGTGRQAELARLVGRLGDSRSYDQR